MSSSEFKHVSCGGVVPGEDWAASRAAAPGRSPLFPLLLPDVGRELLQSVVQFSEPTQQSLIVVPGSLLDGCYLESELGVPDTALELEAGETLLWGVWPVPRCCPAPRPG